MKADRDTFGPRLRVERERRGISLKTIAESTKIKESLFAELERNDLSKWPQGIFRRAHLCAYVSAIGLSPQSILAEFLRVFPEDCPVDQSDEGEVNNPTGVHHAERTPAPSRVAPPVVDRVWVVFFDLAAVCLVSSILAAVVGMNLWPAIAFVGLAYSAVGSACFEQSIGTCVHRRMSAILQTRGRPQATLKMPIREAGETRPIASKQAASERAASNQAASKQTRQTRSSFSQGDTSQDPEVGAHRASA